MSAQDDLQRIALPFLDQARTDLVTYDAKDPETKYPTITPLRPPTGAPNVLLVLIDDAGIGSTTVFEGPCNTPTAELLAPEGLKFNRFPTMSLCSPTRQALGMGGSPRSPPIRPPITQFCRTPAPANSNNARAPTAV
jgi:hypothetical protein